MIVATDDTRIQDAVSEAGYRSVMTSATHDTGTDRIAEAAGNFAEADLIVNVQADEPLIDPLTIDNAIRILDSDPGTEMSTCSEFLETAAEVIDPNIVKVITDSDGFAVYFSRSPIPFPREAVRRYGGLEAALRQEPELLNNFKKHTGLYVYRRPFLMKYVNFKRSMPEKIEMLEQLRAIDMGARIRVVNAAAGSVGVDTRQDYEKVCAAMESH